ncbi:ImuA family protein [Roseobacter sp. S98]|uniref:ImuA family protein n=1 Tax=Roseobacter algicola (ex Choi et al. 2025) (nom. illeg.) TaxID=3092138 RepID=UPI003F5112C2
MPVAHPLLARRPARPTASLPLMGNAPDLQLAKARVHEACGTARRTMAVWLAARATGPVIWISPAWAQDQLNADGLRDWIDPARLIFVRPRRAEDVLWTMEEVLRAGAVALAVADLPGLPGLTQVRRMHLAAETGAAEGQHAPTGLLLTPGNGGAAGVETRWHLAPDHAAGPEGWRLERLRARTAPRRSWQIARNNTDRALCIKTA